MIHEKQATIYQIAYNSLMKLPEAWELRVVSTWAEEEFKQLPIWTEQKLITQFPGLRT